MTVFSRRVATITGVPEERLERLAAESLSEVLLVRWPDGREAVAKSGPALVVEAEMLRRIAAAGAPAPRVEAEYEGVLLLEYIDNDAVFSERAWADAGERLRALHGHTGAAYGWPVDHALGTVTLHNGESRDWPRFWGEQRLVATASVLDRPWRLRVEALARRLGDVLPASPAPSFLHGDLWTGNMLVREGRLVGLIDPACYHGHAEVDLAKLALFGSPPPSFWDAYGALEPGWRQRQRIYQLFPALAHARLWGSSYLAMVDRLLAAAEC